MNKSGILKANRGYQGGYMLAKDPKELTICEILKITEGSIAPVSCLDFEPIQCERAEECSTLYIWQGLYKVITDYLDGITIQDVVDRETQTFSFSKASLFVSLFIITSTALRSPLYCSIIFKRATSPMLTLFLLNEKPMYVYKLSQELEKRSNKIYKIYWVIYLI